MAWKMYCFCVWFAVRHTEHRPPFPPASYITSAVAFKQPCRRRHRHRRRTDDNYRWTHGRRRIGLVGPYARRSCCGGPAGTRPKSDADTFAKPPTFLVSNATKPTRPHKPSSLGTTDIVMTATTPCSRYVHNYVSMNCCYRFLAVLHPVRCVTLPIALFVFMFFQKQPPSGISHVRLARYCRPVTGETLLDRHLVFTRVNLERF